MLTLRSCWRALLQTIHDMRPQRSGDAPPTPHWTTYLDPTPDVPLGIDSYKSSWIAVQGNDPLQLAQHLGLKDIHETNWRSGLYIRKEYSMSHVFVSPVMAGWLLAQGTALPTSLHGKDPRSAPYPLLMLQELGQLYDQVYYFNTNRITDYHTWVRVENGKLVRAFDCYAHEVRIDTGKLIPPESEIEYFKHPAREITDEYGDSSLTPDEDDVLRVARAWVGCPMPNGFQDERPSTGFIGVVPRKFRPYA